MPAEWRQSRERDYTMGGSAPDSWQIDSLSPKGRAKGAGRMAVEPRARLYHGGKCYGFATNRFTFPHEYNIALTDVIHEISWSSRKLLNWHKTL